MKASAKEREYAVEWTPELVAWIETQALEAGFDAVVWLRFMRPEAPSTERDADSIFCMGRGQVARARWNISNAAMKLVFCLRSRVQAAMPWARSVIVCALNYNAAAPLSIAPAPAGTGWIARYAWSGRTR